MVSLGQKLKFRITCQKPFYQIITAVLGKKTTKKTLNIGGNKKNWRSGYLAKAMAHAKGYSSCEGLLQNSQIGSKIKNLKNMPKTFLSEHYSCSVQKVARKSQIFEK